MWALISSNQAIELARVESLFLKLQSIAPKHIKCCFFESGADAACQ
jgi:hypothetical protein